MVLVNKEDPQFQTIGLNGNKPAIDTVGKLKEALSHIKDNVPLCFSIMDGSDSCFLDITDVDDPEYPKLWII